MFESVFPYYLSIGMSADQFWNGDCTLVKAYRKAEEIRKERLNQEMWWQGLYIYEALCNASPLFRAFGKKGSKAAPYPKEPYDIKPRKQDKSRKDEKEKMLKAKRAMEAYAAAFNAARKKKGGESGDGGSGYRQTADSDRSGRGSGTESH